MQPPVRVRGVVFDLDGTLLDTLDDIRITLDRALVAFGHAPRDRATIAAAVGDGARNLVARALGMDVGDARVDPILARYLEEYAADPTPATRPMPGAIELLDHLRASRIAAAVCTNKPRAVTDAVLARVLPGRFEVVVAAGDLERLKPAPDPILRSLQAMGVAPSEAIVVGDGAQDIEAGRAAHVFSVGCTFGYGGQKLLDAHPDATIDRLEELRKFVI